MAQDKIVTFTVDVVGDTTGDKFVATFQTKNRLTHREQLAQDEYRRGLLGANPTGASERALTQAVVFSEINAHLVQPIPAFWKAADMGLELEDENVVAEVYAGVASAIVKYRESLKKDTEAVKADLQKKLVAEEAKAAAAS
jgi:hypothetical protein